SGQASPRSKGNRRASGSTGNEPRVKYWRGRRIEEKPASSDAPDSDDPRERGKIIDFGPAVEDLDPTEGDQDKK
ncbi:MAG: hypothetical protein O6922_06665, partial [Chloroflexi bacterium]|nr:hypothetical protein [Chloroflexota bacterium]